MSDEMEKLREHKEVLEKKMSSWNSVWDKLDKDQKDDVIRQYLTSSAAVKADLFYEEHKFIFEGAPTITTGSSCNNDFVIQRIELEKLTFNKWVEHIRKVGSCSTLCIIDGSAFYVTWFADTEDPDIKKITLRCTGWNIFTPVHEMYLVKGYPLTVGLRNLTSRAEIKKKVPGSTNLEDL